MSMIERISVLGKEIVLPSPMSSEEVETRLEAILSDASPESVNLLRDDNIGIKAEGSILAIFRKDASFG